jgi:phage terminase Nu1 subunit (DNA packaging protein)
MANAKKKKNALSEEKKKVVHLENYKKEIETLREEGRKNYKPKIGRQIAQLERKIKKVA